MSVFNIAKIGGQYEHCGELRVIVIGQVTESKRDPFMVQIGQSMGGFGFGFSMTPDQSRELRKALEDAEAKAEILTAAI